MSAATYGSWGRLAAPVQDVHAIRHRDDALPELPAGRTWLPYGNGRSYGDSCLNDGGVLVATRGLDRFIAFDDATGELECEAGILLADILDLFVPRGWFLPVTPGTRLVTVGGAIANDVHGKSHHVSGTFGRHVRSFELLRSDSGRTICTPTRNGDLYAATIGGLGLTGLVVRATLRMRRVESEWIDAETVKFGALDEFFVLDAESAETHEYTVAWIDCLASGARRGRGLYMRGNHESGPDAGTRRPSATSIRFPFDPPFSLVHRATLLPFNALYYGRQRKRSVRRRQHYRPFFYPLDAITDWNRMYGRRGFFQFQSVVPEAAAREAVGEMLTAIERSGEGSFLAVLKRFGDLPSPGMLSFPRPGVTLALDFPNAGATTHALLDRLEAITLAARGALYPAKDARMSADAFRRSYPRLDAFLPYLDPRCSSSFWRRVHG